MSLSWSQACDHYQIERYDQHEIGADGLPRFRFWDAPIERSERTCFSVLSAPQRVSDLLPLVLVDRASWIRTSFSGRVPIDLGAAKVTDINAIAYNWLKAHLGIRGAATQVFDLYWRLAEVEDSVLQRFQVDIVPLCSMEQARGVWNLRRKPCRLPDGSPCPVSEDLS